MVRAIMHGCSGAMGRVITDLVKDDKELVIAAGVDISEEGTCPYPVYKSLDEVKEEADVIIDFSSAKAADGLLDYCARTGGSALHDRTFKGADTECRGGI